MKARNQVTISGYEANDALVDRVLAELGRHNTVALYGFTSLLEAVARGVIDRSMSIPAGKVRTAWNGGEMLSEAQVELFQRAFGVLLLNYYGGRELSAIAYQAEGETNLRLMRPFLFAEIVDDNGWPCRPGQVGRLILTSTVCRGTPFLRYEVGDLAEYDRTGEDESGIRTLRRLHGRIAGLLRLPNGKTISALYWNHLFKEFPEVRQFQVAIRSAGVALRLRGNGFTEERESQLRRTIQEFTGSLSLSIEWMDNIPRTSQGKLMQVVRE